MHVDAYAGGESRQHLEVKMVHVAAGLGHVRGVDEEHVAGLQSRKFPQRHVLHTLHEQAGDPGHAGLQERPRIGLDAADLAVAAEETPVDVRHQQRGIARSDLHDPPRPPFAQQGEQRARIEPAELRVARVERGQRIAVGQGFRIVVSGQLARQHILQHVAMRGIVELDAGYLRIGRPDPRALLSQRFGIDDRGIEMPRRKRQLHHAWR